MRLLSFVPFGCRAGPVDDAPPVNTTDLAAGDSAAAAAAARRRRRRRRIAAAAAANNRSSEQYYWRPSLGDIYEEYSTAGGEGPAKPRKAASWDVARVLPRDEYRNLESSSSMPAFAPTAYLF